jgi:D-glycerate 3-kinase
VNSERQDLRDQFKEALVSMGLNQSKASMLKELYLPVADWVVKRSKREDAPFVLGVNGAQGAGKTTFCSLLSTVLERGFDASVVHLSIDDLYRTRAERMRLAEEVHPLCAIRGVPGTHDVTMGVALLDALETAGAEGEVVIPRFDKALDDRLPEEAWDIAHGTPDIVLVEGWCVGAQPGPVWDGPINNRESRDDPDGRWYTWSNTALGEDYPALFERLDALLMIRVPSMETVRQSRWLQEEKLWAQVRAEGSERDAPGLMSRDEVLDYVALFERQTEQMLRELPGRADVLIERSDAFDFRLEAPSGRP